MAGVNVNPTRMEMKKLKARLSTARRGHKLLKDKCDELMKQFLDIVRADKDLRIKVETSLDGVHKSFTLAASQTSNKMLEEALILPKREGELTVSYKNLMSVEVPCFDFDIKGMGGVSGINYGYAFTSGELDFAVSELSSLLPDMLKLAELEKTAQMLADEIERTRRRVNALEYIMIPELEVGIKNIAAKLEENERGNTTRLMKVKDMMLERAIKVKHIEFDELNETEG